MDRKEYPQASEKSSLFLRKARADYFLVMSLQAHTTRPPMALYSSPP
jgi:hypothetical protein